MAVTHDMVAVKLGINRTTVTKALKGDLSIKQDTRKKVIETATLMGYDFKQSQQNRREGKRYYAREDVEYLLFDRNNKENQVKGQGRITNLSATGMLIKLEKTETGKIPLGLLDIEILPNQNCVELSEIPVAKVVRLNYINHIECAAKFDSDKYLSEDLLGRIEKQSFEQVDNLKK